MTFELTAGVTNAFSIGVMQLNGAHPGGNGPEYAGWRLLPHIYAPRSWKLQLDIGLVTEFSFQRTVYKENPRRVEVRPMIEKTLRRMQFTANPVFERAIRGPGKDEGWFFEPEARIGYEATKHFRRSRVYYR